MAKVRVLSPEVISKIAAGEVVERPASVVKELVENALDAGATRVEVHLKEGGKSLIHVRDNGGGIAKEDLSALFSRHATSKIVSSDDLEQVLSFGFRGEALYSVGAIAEVTLKSRLKDSTDTWQVQVNGGVRMDVCPAVLPEHGTDIKVESLFFNTPARRKFLKSDTAEAGACIEVVLSAALARPDVHFILTHNGKASFDLPVVPSLRERAAKALQLPAASIHEGQGEIRKDNIRWTLVVGDINIRRPRRDLQYIFVNGRPVQSKGLAFFMNEAFGLVFPQGTYGFFLAFLEIPPVDVDVNVHPAKREVRIRRESEIGMALRRSAEELLMTKSPAKEGASDEPIFPFMPTAMDKGDGLSVEKIIFGPGQKSALPEAVESRNDDAFPWKSTERVIPVRADVEPAASFVSPAPLSLVDRLTHARFIGTFDRKYHLLEEAGSLFVIDQHAAQERIIFEKFYQQVVSANVEVQPLLVPVLIRIDPREAMAFEELAEAMKTLGFDVTLFDDATLALQAYPQLLKYPEDAVRLLLTREALAKADPESLARRACRASVMAGDRMAEVEVLHQIAELLVCKDPYTCPHGRPVVIELKTSFLDRQFLRT
jgi:DNA mismatch repair protein MutL